MTLLLLLAGCAQPDVSYQRDIDPIVQIHCSSCHGYTNPEADLDLHIDGYASLVDTPASQTDLALVEPGDSLYSYLWHKINGTQGLAGGSGTSMPFGRFLADEDVALITAWIDEGAPP